MSEELGNRLSALETRAAVDAVQYANIDKRLTSIEDTLKWLLRLIIGSVVLAALTFALSGGFNV